MGGIAKFLNADPALAERVKAELSLANDTLVLLCAGTRSQVWKTSGVMVKLAGAQCEGHLDQERYEFCWIVDFPLYEIGEESGKLEFCHNPFSMPSGGLEVLLKACLLYTFAARSLFGGGFYPSRRDEKTGAPFKALF